MTISPEQGRRPAPDLRNPVHLLACGFGAGRLPWAPGTWGTLVAIPFYVLLSGLSLSVYLVLLGVAFALGVVLCDRTTRDLRVHDHGGIVWDEMVGYWVTMIAAPSGWLWPLAGFVLFRLFDILKPWPIGWLDARVSGGFGIMIDDVVAAVFAWGGMWLLGVVVL